MKEQCKMAISAALQAENNFPLLFSNNELLGTVCNHYGTEFVAECMLEMGLDKEVV